MTLRKAAASVFLAAVVASSGAHAGTVAVVGDSISVGLAGQLARLDPADRVQSWGIVGSGLSSTKLADWPRRAVEVAAGKPDTIVAQLGTNDATAPLPPDYHDRVDTFLAPFVASGARIICLEPLPPVRPDLVRRMPAVEAEIKDGCARAGAEWVPVGDIPARERAADHVHLDSDGYARLARIVLAALRQ